MLASAFIAALYAPALTSAALVSVSVTSALYPAFLKLSFSLSDIYSPPSPMCMRLIFIPFNPYLCSRYSSACSSCEQSSSLTSARSLSPAQNAISAAVLNLPPRRYISVMITTGMISPITPPINAFLITALLAACFCSSLAVYVTDERSLLPSSYTTFSPSILSQVFLTACT